jgi:hypothetical protein
MGILPNPIDGRGDGDLLDATACVAQPTDTPSDITVLPAVIMNLHS